MSSSSSSTGRSSIARISLGSHTRRGRFEGLPRIRQKTFTIDEQNRRATNVYLWESEDAARGFFSDELVDQVTRLYGVRPTLRFVEVAELVDNA